MVSLQDKKKLISKISNHKLKKQFFLGTGDNSLHNNFELIDHGFKNKFDTYLLMPPDTTPRPIKESKFLSENNFNISKNNHWNL